MRVYVTQQGLSQRFEANYFRFAAEVLDPLGQFPGETWVEGNWAEYTLDGYAPWEISRDLDPSYWRPVCEATGEDFREAAQSDSRVHVALDEDVAQAPIANWDAHLHLRASSPTLYVVGPNATGPQALTEWRQLSRCAAASSFALIVDPYLLSLPGHLLTQPELRATQKAQAKRLGNIVELVRNVLAEGTANPHVVLFARWGDGKQGPAAFLPPDFPTQLQQRLQRRGLGRDVQVTLVQALSSSLPLPREARLHDRYVLTERWSYLCGTGFEHPADRPHFSELLARYNFASGDNLRAFAGYFGELERYLAACISAERTGKLSASDFVQGHHADNPVALIREIRHHVRSSIGELPPL